MTTGATAVHQPPLLTRSEIFADIKRAVHEEWEERTRGAAPAPAEQQVVVAQMPSDPVLAALARFSQEAKTPPKTGELLRINQENKWEVVPQAAILAQASMSQGALGGVVDTLDDVKLFKMALPLGSALIGLPAGTILGEVIDGFVPPRNAAGGMNAMNLVAKGVGVYGALAFGPNLVGKRASQFAAAALLVQVASQFLPIDQWVSQIVGAVRGAGRSVGLKQDYSAASQAESHAAQFQARQDIGPSQYTDVV